MFLTIAFPMILENPFVGLLQNSSKLAPLLFIYYFPQTFSEAEVKTIAICAGSGASLLKGVKADLYLTGEMSHHDILEAVSKNIHVILCDHSNTERGFLLVLKDTLDKLFLKNVNVIVSEVDKDPIVVV